MMSRFFHPPGRHLGATDPTIARIQRDLDRVEAGRHPWHVILWSGVELVTDCEPFVELLIVTRRARLMVTANRAGDRVEVTL